MYYVVFIKKQDARAFNPVICGFWAELGAQRLGVAGEFMQTTRTPYKYRQPRPHNGETLDALLPNYSKGTPNPRRIERAIWREWSKSGDRLARYYAAKRAKSDATKVYDAA